MREYELNLISKNIKIIAGVDEAGRGPVAGPLVASAVILNNNLSYEYINDSKVLSAKKRNEAYERLKEEALAISYVVIDIDIIDKINILEATKLAMIQAINKLSIKPEHVLIDAVKINHQIPNTSIIKGDLKSKSIAAASIVAKVKRDEIMDEYHQLYPLYDFNNNKGYLTKKHREAITLYGPVKIHRLSFEPIKSIVNKWSIIFNTSFFKQKCENLYIIIYNY